MSEFGASATLTVGLDDGSVRSAKQQLEDELNNVPVGVSASGRSPSAQAQPRDPQTGQFVSSMGPEQFERSNLAALDDQQEVLEEIRDEIETGGAGGGGGGGSILTGIGAASAAKGGVGALGAGVGASLGIAGLALTGAAGSILSGKGYADAATGTPQSEQGPVTQAAMEGTKDFATGPAGPLGPMGMLAKPFLEVLETGAGPDLANAFTDSLEWPKPAWVEMLTNQNSASDKVSKGGPSPNDPIMPSPPASGPGGGWGYESAPSGSVEDIKNNSPNRNNQSAEVSADQILGDLNLDLAMELGSGNLERAIAEALGDEVAKEAAKLALREIERQADISNTFGGFP